MKFGEYFLAALNTLWANRARSVLTMIGIVIGTAAVGALLQFASARTPGQAERSLGFARDKGAPLRAAREAAKRPAKDGTPPHD